MALCTRLYSAPCGELLLAACGGRLCLCDWRTSAHHGRVQARAGRGLGGTGGEGDLLAEAAAQLDAYFAGARRVFDLPLLPLGTPFQLRVWEALRGIPYGGTMSYGELAASLGMPAAARAVANAVGANGLSIFLPCHRVTASHGPGGYAGGAAAKRFLLELEGVLPQMAVPEKEKQSFLA